MVTDRGIENSIIIDEDVKTQAADKVMNNVSSAQHNKVLSKAEIFCSDYKLTNLEVVWNEFTFVNNINFDFPKLTVC